MFPYIPHDVLIQILLRLPATSLMRFKCVSKSWNALFLSQEFITSHLQFNRDNIKLRYLSSHSLKDPYGDGLFGNVYSDTGSDVCMMSSCDGLICLYQKPNHLWIWNPATRKCRKLPVLQQDLPGCLEFVAFGYYEPANDYKLVACHCPYGEDNDEYGKYDGLFQIYSMCTHHWETIEYDSYYAKIHPSMVTGLFLNSIPYWLECPESGGICYFDFAIYKFRLIRFPICFFNSYHNYKRKLAVLDGRLCVGDFKDSNMDLWVLHENAKEPIVFDKEPIVLDGPLCLGQGNYMDLWELPEINAKEPIWTKFVSINNTCVLDILHISRKGEILTIVKDKCLKRWLMLYDSEVGSQRLLAIPTEVEEMQSKVFVYSESLISIPTIVYTEVNVVWC